MKSPAMNELKEAADFQANTTPTLGADEVLIKVCAATISQVEVLQYKKDKEDEPSIRECSGCIIKVGRSVTRWRIGDKVCALLKGIRYAEEVVVSTKCVLRVPSNIPLAYAAGFPLETCNFHYAINTCLELSEGDILVVLGRSLHLTLCAIEVARRYGVRVFVIAAHEEQMDIYKWSGAEACINVRKENIAERVRSLSGEKGANGVICYGTDKITEYSRCLANDGKILFVWNGLANDGKILLVWNGMPVETEIKGGFQNAVLAGTKIIVCNMYLLVTSLDEKTLESLICEVERYIEWPDHKINYLPRLMLHVSNMKTAVGLIESGQRGKIILTTKEELSLVSKLLSKAGEIFKAKAGEIFKALKRKVD